MVNFVATKNHNFAKLREAAKREVNRDAERARASLFDLEPGDIYAMLARSDEARRWLAATNPQAKDYPLLAAEKDARGGSMNQAANRVLAKTLKLHEDLAAIERDRMRRRDAIDAAPEKLREIERERDRNRRDE